MKRKSGLADSPFFRPMSSEVVTPISETSDSAEQSPIVETERFSERNSVRSEIRTDQLPKRRRTTRYSFEFFEDQILKFKQIKREAEDRGERLTLSDIAREAFDLYLRDKNR